MLYYYLFMFLNYGLNIQIQCMLQNFAFALKYAKEFTGSYETVAHLRWTGKDVIVFLHEERCESLQAHYWFMHVRVATND